MSLLRTRVKFNFDVKGVRKAVEQAGEKPIGQAALMVERKAKEILNVGGGVDRLPSKPGEPPHKQTGNLQNSIMTARVTRRLYIVGPTLNAFYGRVLEFGGRLIAARPFMFPALKAVKPRISKLWKNLPLSRTSAGRQLNSKSFRLKR